MDFANVRLDASSMLVAAAAVLVVLLLFAARVALARAIVRARVRARSERATDGEARAEVLLLRAGCEIEGRQVTTRYTLSVDGDPASVELRADYVVWRKKRRYVAEVKTGRLAPRLDTAATRRQLLEYRVAFDVDGVLLVDAEAGRVHVIDFPLPLPRRSGTRLDAKFWLLAAAVAVAVFTLASASFR